MARVEHDTDGRSDDSRIIGGSNDSILQILGHRQNPYINRLPYEVLAHIFQLFVDEDMEIFFARPCASYACTAQPCRYVRSLSCGAFTLGAICQTWRSIAWTSHRLWASLGFCRTETTETEIQLAIEWLGRSGNLPLSIYLHAPSEIESLLIPLMDVINLSLNRCRQLSLISLSSLILSRLTHGSKAATAFEYLKIGPNTDLPVNFASAAPIKLEISSMKLAKLILKWTALTELDAELLCVYEILQILTLTPQIVRCNLSEVEVNLESTYKSEPIKCIELEHITMNPLFENGVNIFHIFFQAMTAPKLRYYSMESYHAGDFPTEAFMDFLARSCCAITDLCIEEQSITPEYLIRITQALPSLTSLSLKLRYLNVPETEWCPLFPFYNALCLDARDPTILHNEALLPVLKNLSIATQHQFPWYHLPKLRSHKQHPSDSDSVYTIEQGRPYLESISIVYNHYQRNFFRIPSTTDETLEQPIVSETLHGFLIPDWETFSALLELKGDICLELAVDYMQTNQKESMFYLSYRALEQTAGAPPDHIRIAMEDILQAPREFCFDADESSWSDSSEE